MNITPTPAFENLLDGVSECLTPEAARNIIKLRASPQLQARIEELASKNTEGELTPQERADYESLVWAGNFIAILQAKARKMLAKNKT